MSKLRLFEVAILVHPEETDKKGTTELVGEKTSVLAKDEKTAGMQAVRLIPNKYATNLDRIEVIVRPF